MCYIALRIKREAIKLDVLSVSNKQSKMMKLLILAFALFAAAVAKPALLSAPLIAPASVVTATSSQYDIRVNNGLAAYVAAPYTAYAAAPYVAAPYAAAPYVAAPYAAAPYVAAPYVAL